MGGLVSLTMRRTMDSVWMAVGVLLLGLALTACKPSYPKCSTDKNCKEHEYCVNGQCQQCRGDQDCSGGKCNNGRCEAASAMKQACTDDTQCPSGQSCIDGACKPCRADAECGEGGKCNNGRCDRPGSGSTGSTGNSAGCALEPVYFDFNENVLSTEATAAIDRNAECLKQGGKGGSVSLTGHSDPRGTEEYNLALSDRRAQAVRDRLTRMGFINGAMKLVPKGELEASGTDESGWAKDRRVDVAH